MYHPKLPLLYVTPNDVTGNMIPYSIQQHTVVEVTYPPCSTGSAQVINVQPSPQMWMLSRHASITREIQLHAEVNYLHFQAQSYLYNSAVLWSNNNSLAKRLILPGALVYLKCNNFF